MQKENRSSNTEIKPCPFCGGKAESRCTAGPDPDWFVQCTECRASTDVFSEDNLTGWNNRALTAEQHQGEPVALPSCKAKLSMSHDWDQGHSDGWKDCLEEISKLGPLYTHVDAGEVVALRSAYLRAGEREHNLRTQLHQLNTAFNEWIDKSQWARKGAVADELGMHLADVIKKRYDQLQAELNARDQRIDRFEQVLQKIAKLRGTLDQHGLLEEVEGLLWPDLHSTPEERGTPEAEPCSGCGTPGWTGNCEKCIPY